MSAKSTHFECGDRQLQVIYGTGGACKMKNPIDLFFKIKRFVTLCLMNEKLSFSI